MAAAQGVMIGEEPERSLQKSLGFL